MKKKTRPQRQKCRWGVRVGEEALEPDFINDIDCQGVIV